MLTVNAALAHRALTAPSELQTNQVEGTPCVVTGEVKLMGRTNHGGTQVLLDGFRVGTTSASGEVLVEDVAPGPFLLAVSHAGYLTARGFGSCKSADIQFEPVELPGGDADGDDDVDLFDMVLLGANYGLCQSDSAFDPRADVNESTCVDLFDLVLLGGSYGTAGPVAWEPPPATDGVSFAADVQPIFDSSCIRCHGAGTALDLTSYDGVMSTEHEAIVVPGDPESSRLYQVISGAAPPPMPPGSPLAPETVELIRQWIGAGAPNN